MPSLEKHAPPALPTCWQKNQTPSAVESGGVCMPSRKTKLLVEWTDADRGFVIGKMGQICGLKAASPWMEGQ